jgi:uncharacterized protein
VAEPERTCLGCRNRRQQGDLVRLVAIDGRLTLAGKAAPGRGAYVCAEQACFDKAVKRRAFDHALRQAIEIDSPVGETFARVCAERKAVR